MRFYKGIEVVLLMTEQAYKCYYLHHVHSDIYVGAMWKLNLCKIKSKMDIFRVQTFHINILIPGQNILFQNYMFLSCSLFWYGSKS